MKNIYNSLKSLHDHLTDNNIEYAIIGGLSLIFWGESRITRDIDVKLLLSRDETEKFLRLIENKFKPFINNPAENLNEYGILFVQDATGMRIDFHLSDTSFDRIVIERAELTEVEPGVKVNICTAEDLIIYKMLSTRDIDRRDIESILDYQGKSLDDNYIIGWLKQFEEALNDSTLVDIYQKIRSV